MKRFNQIMNGDREFKYEKSDFEPMDDSEVEITNVSKIIKKRVESMKEMMIKVVFGDKNIYMDVLDQEMKDEIMTHIQVNEVEAFTGMDKYCHAETNLIDVLELYFPIVLELKKCLSDCLAKDEEFSKDWEVSEHEENEIKLKAKGLFSSE